MSEQTLSIKFIEGGSQEARLDRLSSVCARLLATGAVSKAQPHAVFPGDPDPTMAALFTVDVAGKAADLAGKAIDSLTRQFSQINGVVWVQMAGDRRSLAGSSAPRIRRSA